MQNIRIIPIILADGTEIKIEATEITPIDDSGESEVSSKTTVYEFEKVKTKISAISNEVISAVEKKGLTKVSVKFGIEIGIETDGITAIFAKGTAKANLEVTLEWSK